MPDNLIMALLVEFKVASLCLWDKFSTTALLTKDNNSQWWGQSSFR